MMRTSLRVFLLRILGSEQKFHDNTTGGCESRGIRTDVDHERIASDGETSQALRPLPTRVIKRVAFLHASQKQAPSLLAHIHKSEVGGPTYRTRNQLLTPTRKRTEGSTATICGSWF